MKVKDKTLHIFLNTLPVILMIILIPVFTNDYVLTCIYALIIVVSFIVKYDPKDYVFFLFGFVMMIVIYHVMIPKYIINSN